MSWKYPRQPKKFKLNDIPTHAQLSIGDTIETSGYSSIFPEGIMLGTIDTFFLEPAEYFYNIEFTSEIDMGKIQYVYIVKNLFKQEIESLEQALLEEDE